MPIPMQPFRLHCTNCDWSMLVNPRSDVLMPHELPNQCPQCGQGQLSREAPNLLDKIKALLVPNRR